MRLISRLRDQRYCAFCKSPRKLYVKKHVDLTNVVGVLLVSAAITYAMWGGPDPRGVLVFVTFILTGEIFIYLRWRAAIVCRLCGFDPVVYKKSPEKAAQLVNQFFREQAENPSFWLSKSPLLQLHRRLREEEKRREDISALRKYVASKPKPQPKAVQTASRPGAAAVPPARGRSAADIAVPSRHPTGNFT